MKKYYFLFILLLLLPSLTVLKALDLSEYFTVNNAKICADTNCTSYYDENNGLASSSYFAVKFSWSLNTQTPINDGDTIIIPFANEKETEYQTSFVSYGFSWTDIYDENQNKIGKWMMSGKGENRIVTIQLSDHAIGKTNLEGTFITTRNINTNSTFIDKNVYLTVGNKKAYFKIKANTYSEGKNGASITKPKTSNSYVNFMIRSPGITVKQLYDISNYPTITSSAIFNDLYLEFFLPEYLNGKIDNYLFEANTVLPTSLNGIKASSVLYPITASSDFTKVEQYNGESYNDFKNRLAEFEYGIYLDGNNRTFVVNFGSQPSKTKTYEYFISKIDNSVSLPGDYFNSLYPFTFDSTLKTIYNNVYGNSNRIGGKVVSWGVTMLLKFPTVTVPTTKTVNAIWSYKDIDGKDQQQQVSADISLVVPSSIANLKEESKLILRDLDTKNEIVGARIKLQKQVGNSFIDVKEGITDTSGMISFNNLESGVYRYVQTEYLPHYITNSFKSFSDVNLENIITTFEFDSTIGNVVYATNEMEKYNVKFLPGSHGAFDEKTYSNLLYGSITPNYEAVGETDWIFKGWSPNKNIYVTENISYTALWKKMVKVTTRYLEEGTNNVLYDEIVDIDENDTEYTTIKRDINNYEYTKVEGDISGVRGLDDIVVTYYYKRKESLLNIDYVDCKTQNSVAQSTVVKLYYGDSYDSDDYEQNIVIAQNYNRVAAMKSDNYKAIANSDTINVTYCYSMKDSSLNTSIVKTGIDKITSSSDKASYKIDYNASFTDYIGDASITIVDNLPYKIDVNNSNLDGGIYDSEKNTITWSLDISVNSYEQSNYQVTKNIELLYLDIDSSQDVMINSVKGSIKAGEKNQDAKNIYNTYIDINGTIIIKYLDTNKKELLDSIVRIGKVGSVLEIDDKIIEGYKIINRPKESYEFIEGNKNIEFIYERLKYKIITSAKEGGTITGDEEVYYGENSKVDNIKIEASSGYYIKSLSINDEKIKIPDMQTKLTVPNFINMKEDKYITVTFSKIDNNVLVPNTKKNTSLILILIGISAILFSIFVINKRVLKKLK